MSGMRGRAAVVGVGSTPYYRRGQSLPKTRFELACDATLAALGDAGLTVRDVDGFAYYSGGVDTSLLAQVLGVPEVRFTAGLTGGGGGSAGSIGLAAAAITAGLAEVVVTVFALQQAKARFGAIFGGGGGPYQASPSPEMDFIGPYGLAGPGQMFAILARRHMHLYGTQREHLAEVAISTRANASRRETALFREPLTLEKYFEAPMIADPLCLYDFCMESDGAVACITTTAERARDMRHPPAYVLGSTHGGHGRWGQAITWFNMPDEYFVSSGHRPIAQRLWEQAGVKPGDVDVALLYDHFTPMVLMQLEDYGFCGIGEGGPFVEGGRIRWPDGELPLNTHGGNLSEAYIVGITHVREGVEQIRGTAVNQVKDCEIALATGGPASIPTSALLLGRSA
jgi:acetyl-CoA acetyltransferase